MITLRIIRRGAAAFVVASTLMTGAAAVASAAPAVSSPVSATSTKVVAPSSAQINSDGTLDVVTPKATYTFSNSTTKRLYQLAVGGSAASITAACVLAAPPPFKPFCPLVALAIIAIADAGAPGDHDCYQIYTRLGIPPVGVRIVDC